MISPPKHPLQRITSVLVTLLFTSSQIGWPATDSPDPLRRSKPLTVVSFNDAPDPFRPSRETNDLTIGFKVRKPDTPERPGRLVEFFIEVIETVRNPSGKPVQIITTKTPVDFSLVAAGSFLEVMTVNSWDGKNRHGQIVQDRIYQYSARGKLVREITFRGRRAESVLFQSDKVRGTIEVKDEAPPIDQTPPIIHAVVTPAPNAQGWNHTDVTVSFTATDDESGVDTVTPEILVTTEGAGQEITGTATDKAGNSASTSVLLNIDKTAPAISILSPLDGSKVHNARSMVTANINDALSGVDVPSMRIFLDGSDVTAQASVSDTQASFTPAIDLPDGPHTAQIELRDRAGNLTQAQTAFTVEVVVEPPVSPESGFIHGTVMHSISKEAIEDAIVTIQGLQGTVLTNAQGQFTFPTPGAGRFIATVVKEGFTNVQRAAQIEAKRDIAVDPVFLTPLDPQVTRIDSNGGIHTSSDGEIVVQFPQGAVTTPIDVRATHYRAGDHLPAPLPEQSHFTYAVNFEPDGAVFNTPVTYRIRNDLGFDAGTPIPVGIYDEATASWQALNMAQVTPDGQWVEGELPHFSSIDCNLPAFIRGAIVSPVIPIGDLIFDKNKNNRCMVPGCEIDLYEGALRADITLPAVKALGRSESLVFRYDSSQAYPTVLIGSRSGVPSYVQLSPTAISSQFEFQGGRSEITYEGSLGEVVLRHVFPARNGRGAFLPTGLYPFHYRPSNDYSLKYATADFFNGPPRQELAVVSPELVSFTSPITRNIPVVNERQSPFGAGWSMEGLERIHIQPDQTLLLTDGAGSALTFLPGYRLAGPTPEGGQDPEAPFFLATAQAGDMAVDSQGNLYVTDGLSSVSKVTPDGTVTPFPDTFNFPGAITVDAEDNVYVSELAAEVPVWKYPADGSPRELYFHSPDFLPGGWTELQFDQSGQLYAGGRGVFRLNPDNSSSIVFEVVGVIEGIVFDSTGKLFATESPITEGPVGGDLQTFGIPRVIERFADGFVSTYAAGFLAPSGLVLDSIGNLFVADQALNQILKVTPNRLAEPIIVGDNLGNATVRPASSAHADGMIDIALTSAGDLLVSHRYAFTGIALGTVSKIVPTNQYFPPQSDFSELVKNPDNTFAREMKDGILKEFDTQGFLKSIKDRNGNTTFYAYDSEGRLAEITNPVGAKTILSYGPAGKLDSVLDPAGRTIDFQIDSSGDLTQVVFPDNSTKQFSYDSEHRLVSETDSNQNTTDFVYDDLGQLTEEILPARTVIDNGTLVTKRSSRKFEPEQASALSNNVPDGSGTPQNPAPSFNSSDVSSKYEDALGRETIFQSTNGQLGTPKSVQNALGHETKITRGRESFFFNFQDETLPLEIDSPNGLYTRFEYDDFGNMLSIFHSQREVVDPNFPDSLTFFSYDPLFHQLEQITTPLGRQTFFTYDTFGNLSQISDPLGPSGPYQTQFSYTSQGLLTEVIDPLQNKTSFTYDASGNLKTTTDPLLKTTTLDYDPAGNVIRSEDSLGHVTEFQYDPLNRLTQVKDPNLGVTQYQYDPSGNLTQVMDSKGNKTQFEYNSLNELVKVIDPAFHETHFFYDEAGNLVRTTDRKGQTIDFQYDALNRLIQKAAPEGAVSFEYDPAGNTTRAQDPDSLLRFQYDLLSRLTKAETGDPGNLALTQPITTLNYEYDAVGNRVKTVSPQGETQYDYLETLPGFGFQVNRGNLVTLTNSFNEVFTFDYDELSRRTKLTRPNNTQTQYPYSPRNELLGLDQITYTYDEVGNKKTRTDPEGLHSYFYDPLNQLTQVQGPRPESYTYDSLGNRLSSHLSSSYTTNSLNQLTEDNTFLYRYDLNGNLIQKEEKSSANITTYTYDSENQLVEIGPVPISYRYDALGRRIEKNINGQIARYVYDGEGILLQYDSNNQLIRSFTHGPGIDEPLALRDNVLNQSFFYHTDGLGSITSLTDSTANTIESYTYDSYGNPEIKDSTNSVIPQSLIGSPYLFTGREYDPESKLHYLRARYLDPRIGRFLAEEPTGIGLLFERNTYMYGINNPTRFGDPFGLLPQNFTRRIKFGIFNVNVDFKKVQAELNKVLNKDKRFQGKFTEAEFGRIAQLATGTLTEEQFDRLIKANPEQQEQVRNEVIQEVLGKLGTERENLLSVDQILLDRVNELLPEFCSLQKKEGANG